MSTPVAKSSKVPGNRDLTEDAILEILLRLPVKSLVRFKCVCKQWYAIVESQSFIKQHFGHRSNKERLLVRRLKDSRFSVANALFVDDNCSEFEEPAHFQMPDQVSLFLGPVNGVICLEFMARNLALLNPAMRRLKPLPKLPRVIVEPHLRFFGHVHGFGLDPLSGDYKVVLIRYFLDKRVNVRSYYPIVFVYNLSGDSWRKLKDVGCFRSSYRAYGRSPCKPYLNGVYYWTMECTGTNVAAILAFDMTTVKFQEIQVPDCCKSKLGHLTIQGDSIALLPYNLEGAGLCEVWVMEKKGSWNKIAVVGPYEAMGLPLCLLKNDELLIDTETRVLLQCNIFTKKRQRISRYVSRVFSYKESLVSIKGKRDNCMLWDGSLDMLTIEFRSRGTHIFVGLFSSRIYILQSKLSCFILFSSILDDSQQKNVSSAIS